MPSPDRLDEIDAEIAEIEKLVAYKESEAATLYDGAAVAARARINEIRVVLDELKLNRVEIAAKRTD